MFTSGCLRGFIRTFHRNKDLDGFLLQVSRAPEPIDIDWVNISVSPQIRLKRRIITIIGAGFFTLIGFALVVWINYVQATNSDSASSSNVSLSVTSSFAVFLVNFCIVKVVTWLGEREKRSTYTSLKTTLAKKFAIVKLNYHYLNYRLNLQILLLQT